MAKHTLIYLGNFDRNFAPTGAWPRSYVSGEGKTKVAQPSKGVDGFRFGYMQKDADYFYLVNVEALRLRAPVLLEPARHTGGKGFGPVASLFDDTAAMRLLADAIVANPEYRDQLAEFVRTLGK